MDIELQLELLRLEKERLMAEIVANEQRKAEAAFNAVPAPPLPAAAAQMHMGYPHLPMAQTLGAAMQAMAETSFAAPLVAANQTLWDEPPALAMGLPDWKAHSAPSNQSAWMDSASDKAAASDWQASQATNNSTWSSPPANTLSSQSSHHQSHQAPSKGQWAEAARSRPDELHQGRQHMSSVPASRDGKGRGYTIVAGHCPISSRMLSVVAPI
jgi:hypothetical protein